VKNQDLPGGMSIGLLPHEQGEIGGYLYVGKDNAPSPQGSLLYLRAPGRLDAAVAEVNPNGGKVLRAKQDIGPYGYRAIILESEGTRLALYSM
jgi:predicted enzyme related to lactoylglutathione lyase